ncbi:MAG TPA: hypothetical protein VEU55_08535 [Gemmatimonadales bacterium]|nr:hypothetical protein [Gemmatimonadales bacterium]
MFRTPLAALTLLATLAFTATAQELPKAKKWTNVRWYRVTDYTFKPGKRAEALKIAYEHLVPALKAAGVEVSRTLEHTSGEWDITVIGPMDGPGDLEYEVTPRTEKYRAALARLEGGADKAQQVLDRIVGMIDRAQSVIVMERQ